MSISESTKVANGLLLILDIKVNEKDFKSTTTGKIVASDVKRRKMKKKDKGLFLLYF